MVFVAGHEVGHRAGRHRLPAGLAHPGPPPDAKRKASAGLHAAPADHGLPFFVRPSQEGQTPIASPQAEADLQVGRYRSAVGR